MRLVVVTECACHIWIEDSLWRAARGAGRCGRCRQRTQYRGQATPEAESVCKHLPEPCRV